MHERVGHVSVSRCAELLAQAGDPIDRSALTRYCDRHGLKLGRQGRAAMVDFETVLDHRRANYTREVMSGGSAGASPAPSVAPPASNITPIPPRDDPARGLKEIQLRQALREEAIAEERLTAVAEVDAGAAEAIAVLRAAFAQAGSEQAEQIAADLQLPSEKVRPLRAALRRFARIGQDRFAQSLATALAAGNETDSEAHARLTRLAAEAVRLRARPMRTAVAA